MLEFIFDIQREIVVAIPRFGESGARRQVIGREFVGQGNFPQGE
jgi:hypothetical protein